MPQTREAVFEDLSGLLQLVLCQLVVSAGRHIFIAQEDEIHPFLYEMQKEFGEDFPELGRAHFMTTSNFPWSENVSNAIWTLHQTEVIYHAGKHFMIMLDPGTERTLKVELNRHLADDKLLRERFLLFVSRFETLTRQP